MLSSQILEAVFQTVHAAPSSAILSAAAVLESAASISNEVRSRVIDSMPLSNERTLFIALLDQWAHEPDPPSPAALAAALRAAAHTRAAMLNRQHIELVWTGPSPGANLRRIEQALFQVIQSAQRELWLITFAAYRSPLLMDALNAAVDRGVRICFVSESVEESEGKISADPILAFGRLADSLTLYIWPREKRDTDSQGNFGALHAKCALADEVWLLVSSANLTDHALILNMELGLLIHGGPLPSQTKRHFTRLISSGILIPT